MITIDPNYDLTKLADRFITKADYTKEVILEELQYWQKNGDFLCMISGDAFLVGYRNRSSLWIAQIRSAGGYMLRGEALREMKKWCRERGLTSITFETTRDEMKAFKRSGFEKYSTIMEAKI